MASKSNRDIPGYYWDPATRRYYKEDPAHPRPKVSPSSTDSHSHHKSASCPKHVLDILKKREMGFCKYPFEDRVVSLNLNNLHCIKEIKHDSSTYEEVAFLKGGEYSVYLELSSKCGTYLVQKKHFFSPQNNFPTLYCLQKYPFSTVDLCEGIKFTNTSSLFVIDTDSSTWRMSLQEQSAGRNRVVDFYNSDINSTPIWCCDRNDFTSQFAIGKENIVYRSSFCPSIFSRGCQVRGEVRSVQFNKQGNLIYAGLHTGHVEILDSRTKRSVYRTRLHNKGIDETVLVFDEKQLVCGAFDGVLCNFDLRMRRPICEYYGHVRHSPRKVPFSINEPNNLLCATGSDNVTRLWSLGGGGEPIKSIQPPEDGHACYSWLVSDGYKYLVYQYQKSNTYVYGTGNIEFLPDSKF